MSEAETPRSAGVQDCPFHHADGLEFDPLLSRLLTEDPVARIRMRYGTEEAWLATRYRDVQVVTEDRRFSRAAGVGRDLPRMTPEPIAHPDAINLMDPPAHTRLRRVIASGLSPGAVERLRPRAEQIVDRLLNELVAEGAPADLVGHFSDHLPLAVMSEMFGIPEQDRDWLRQRTISIMTIAPERGIAASDAKAELREYFTDLVAHRRREGGNDLLSAMCQADSTDEPLSDSEVAMLGQVLMVAGHDTLTYEISNIVYVLLTHEAVLAQIRARPERLPRAIEELLRFIPFRQGVGIARIAMEDVELGGRFIRADDTVHVSYLTANRDGEVFPQPDEIDVNRTPKPHMTFGYGPHRCPGAQLARMELQVAIGALLHRFPNLRLAVDPDDIEWNASSIWRFPVALPVRW
ncbi:cytochrome P450 [Micromonospora sp. NBC_01813]|uniref:cytochrome P450 n=1 Tax=Micromonospora sp. NBC_01813 TaxID=2975988 RepID=UPI002DD8F9A6|nr:cytochrome P450 [Micromonospora sp. NBC_01813]WSA12292.1 cytochrome P450 [Micromonospora sp. NBC_01813]